MLSYNLSYFQEDWRKFCPDIRDIFLCNKELHKKLAPILIVSQRRHHSEKTKTGINFNLDVVLTSGCFLKVIFFEAVSVENIKQYAFSRVQHGFKGVFNRMLLNNPPASCFLINLNFVLSHTTHFDKIISFLL